MRNNSSRITLGSRTPGMKVRPKSQNTHNSFYADDASDNNSNFDKATLIVHPVSNNMDGSLQQPNQTQRKLFQKLIPQSLQRKLAKLSNRSLQKPESAPEPLLLANQKQISQFQADPQQPDLHFTHFNQMMRAAIPRKLEMQEQDIWRPESHEVVAEEIEERRQRSRSVDSSSDSERSDQGLSDDCIETDYLGNQTDIIGRVDNKNSQSQVYLQKIRKQIKQILNRAKESSREAIDFETRSKLNKSAMTLSTDSLLGIAQELGPSTKQRN